MTGMLYHGLRTALGISLSAWRGRKPILYADALESGGGSSRSASREKKPRTKKAKSYAEAMQDYGRGFSCIAAGALEHLPLAVAPEI